MKPAAVAIAIMVGMMAELAASDYVTVCVGECLER